MGENRGKKEKNGRKEGREKWKGRRKEGEKEEKEKRKKVEQKYTNLKQSFFGKLQTKYWQMRK